MKYNYLLFEIVFRILRDYVREETRTEKHELFKAYHAATWGLDTNKIVTSASY